MQFTRDEGVDCHGALRLAMTGVGWLTQGDGSLVLFLVAHGDGSPVLFLVGKQQFLDYLGSVTHELRTYRLYPL